MTLAIHEQGGLTEAEIKLAIEESAERREATLDTKLTAHRQEIKEELDRTACLVNFNNSRLIDMQGQISAIAKETENQTEKLESILRNGEEWHQADLKFREEVLGRIGAVEKTTTDLSESVSRLQWIGIVCFGAGKVARFTFAKMREAEVWKIAATVLLLWVLALISPEAAQHVQEWLK